MSRLRLIVTGAGIVLLVGAAVLAALTAHALARSLTMRSSETAGGATPAFVEGDTASGTPAAPGGAPVNPSAPLTEPEMAAWDGVGRVTILLLGLDYRDWEANEKYSRSDTMILLTLDPLAGKAGILSVPRDMWVAIPGFKHGKINTAYYLGDAYKLPGGGPGLAVKTLEQFLGVPINYYAQIDFGAFVRFIDEIGGVKIDVPERITIDLLGSGAATKKTLQPGVQTLPGEWALAYARARYTEGGDFDRARRQQQVILAIRDRILSLDMLPILIEKSDVLYRELAGGVHTNLTLDEATRLALLTSRVKEEHIQRGVIGKEYVLFGQSPDGLSILIPLPDKIHTLRDEIFAASGALGPLTQGNSQERMAAEAARVAVLDGSGNGVQAESSAAYLRGQGLNVISEGTSEQPTARSTLILHRPMPFTASFLMELVNISPQAVVYAPDAHAAADIELILAEGWKK